MKLHTTSAKKKNNESKVEISKQVVHPLDDNHHKEQTKEGFDGKNNKNGQMSQTHQSPKTYHGSCLSNQVVQSA
jgi:hypothetical protein